MPQINFSPSKKQDQAWEYLTDNKTNFIGYGGSARSGKSFLGVNWLTIMSLAYPGTAWGLGRKELKNLKRTTLVTLFNLFRDSQIEKDIHYGFNQQDKVITFFNGSKIYLIDTAHQPSDPLYTRFGGLELTGCMVDESNETPYKAVEILFSRCGWCKNDEYGIIAKMLETFNPDKGHVYRRYYKPTKTNTQSNNRKFISALPADNPDPKVQRWIEDMIKSADQVTIERLIKGNFEYDDDKATLISFNAIQNYWNGQQVKQEGDKYLTIDVARKGKDKTVFRVWHGWVCIERVEMLKSKVNEVVDEARKLQKKHQIKNSNTVADEDGVGGGVVDYLGCSGFVNNSQPVEEVIGDYYIKPNYANLKTQCTVLMAKKITKGEVTEACNDGTIIDLVSEEMEQVKYKDIDKDGKVQIVPKDKVVENIGRSPDDWDSIMMRYYFELIPKVVVY